MTYTVGGSLLTIDPAATHGPPVRHESTLGSGQVFVSWLPAAPTGLPGIIFTHLAGSGPVSFMASIRIDLLAQRMAAYGFAVIAGEDGGPQTWGNDTGRADVDECRTYLIAQGAHATKLGFVGVSMGLITALSWVGNSHTADTFAVAGIIGVADLVHAHDNVNEPTFAGLIDAAYTDHAGYLAAIPTHDPQTLAEGGAFAGLHVAQWVGDADVTAPAVDATALATAIGSTASTVHHLPGTHLTTLQTYDQTSVSSYLIGQWPATAEARQLVI